MANFIYKFALMRIHALKTLKLFWKKYPDAEPGLRTWYSKVEENNFKSPQELTTNFKGADYIGNERIVFNITRNKYRLIVAFNYEYQICLVKFLGTHKEYDQIDAKSINYNE